MPYEFVIYANERSQAPVLMFVNTGDLLQFARTESVLVRLNQNVFHVMSRHWRNKVD